MSRDVITREDWVRYAGKAIAASMGPLLRRRMVHEGFYAFWARVQPEFQARLGIVFTEGEVREMYAYIASLPDLRPGVAR
ncbi:MAG TPA: hypothetical protein VN903_09710 [Polyangia bacterium]|nr:hypothetical protein [Polyangia bacterium]